MLFAVAVALHGIDHLRRGMNALPPAVMIAGMVQIVLTAITVALVFWESRWAPHAAVVISFVSAAGFTAAHLLQTWGYFSDSFINAPPSARVTSFFGLPRSAKSSPTFCSASSESRFLKRDAGHRRPRR